MKITNNPSLVQNNNDSFKFQKSANSEVVKNSSQKAQAIVDPISISTKTSQTTSSINNLQQEQLKSQQMFGSLTQLTDALELFQQKPNAYQENIQKILQEVKKDFPQLSKNLEKYLDDPKKMLVETKQMGQTVSATIASQKKSIAQYLIAGQNRDSIRKKDVNSPSISRIIKQLSTETAPKLHQTRVANLSNLLS